MTFNIGSQNGGVINNIVGDQHIEGGQYGVLVTTGEAREAAVLLQQLAQATSAPPPLVTEVTGHADAVNMLVQEPQPDKAKVAHRLEQLTQALTSAGAVVRAGAPILGPIQTLATWLGPLGEPIRHLVQSLV